MLGLHKEGIQKITEALEIYGQLNHEMGQAQAWQQLGVLLISDGQLDAAEEAASKAIHLFLEKGNQFEVCKCYGDLGDICHSRGETEKAINHHETAIGIASSFNWADILFGNHYRLAELFFGEDKFDDAHSHVERAKSHATNDPYRLGRAMELQAMFWYKRRMLKEAKSEVLSATDVYEKIGATKDVEGCRVLLRKIEEAASREVNSNGEFLETLVPSTPANSPWSA